MTSSPIQFLWNLNTNRPRAYLSDSSNFILIEHKRPEIQSNDVNRELWRKKWVLRHSDLDLWPKVTNSNRVQASAVSNYLAKNMSKSVHLSGWNFVHKQSFTDTHTNWSENITPPRFRGGVTKWLNLNLYTWNWISAKLLQKLFFWHGQEIYSMVCKCYGLIITFKILSTNFNNLNEC